MALDTKPASRWWYARLLVKGKLRRFSLMEMRGGRMERLEVKGFRPKSMNIKRQAEWDPEFLESYHRAKAAHDRLKEEDLSNKKHVEELAQRIIEAKTGTRLDFVKMEAVPEAWAAIPRKRPMSPRYRENAQAALGRFSAFVKQRFPGVDDLAGVRADQVRAFLAEEGERGIAPRTWNVTLKLLKTVFKRLEPNSDAYRAFLKDATFLEEETVHREPFDEEGSEAVLKSAKEDPLLYGPIVTAFCTAMRRSDCVRLKWSGVDLAKGFIEARTSKDRKPVEIPILPLLRDVLKMAPRTGEYVFPEAAQLCQTDRHSLDRRFRAILTRAGFINSKAAARIQSRQEEAAARPVLPQLSPDEVLRRGLEAIAAGKMIEAKRERMRVVLTAYMGGKGLPTIARDLGLSKSTVSLQLNEVEKTLGVTVLRRPAAPEGPKVIRGAINAENGTANRLKRGSIRGWHSFRVAFVTRALAGGMPEELVRRVTGHSAVEVVRKHYFRPGREEFRREFEGAMPSLAMNGAMNGAKPRDEQLKEIVEQISAKTFKRDKARMLALLAGTEH